MGSDFCTYEEAAKKLGVSTRTIYSYVQQGRIHKEFQNGRVVLRMKDVEQEAVSDQRKEALSFNHENFVRMHHELEQVKMKLAFAERTWNGKFEPLRPSAEEAQGMYQAAQHYGRLEGIPPFGLLQAWSEIFVKLDEVALKKIITAVQDPKAWAPLYAMCCKFMDAVSSDPLFKTSLALQALHARLEEGRTYMKQTILLWVELAGGAQPQELKRSLASRKERVLDRV